MAYQVNLPATLRCGPLVVLLLALILQALNVRIAAAFVTADTLNSDNVRKPLTLTSNTPPKVPQPSGTCKSIEVRTRSDFELLKNCKRVHGHVWLAHMQLTPSYVSALEYLTEVEEITDYLLVHRVHGLFSLHHIFPHLRIIRGRRLLFDEFALIIYENRDLRYLGLNSLIRIQAGNIRIETNPSLCYVNTVNWVQLLGNSTRQHFWHKVILNSSNLPASNNFYFLFVFFSFCCRITDCSTIVRHVSAPQIQFSWQTTSRIGCVNIAGATIFHKSGRLRIILSNVARNAVNVVAMTRVDVVIIIV